MCLVPARNGDRIARDDRDGRKALAEHIPRNAYSEPKITYLKDPGKGLDRSAMTHGNSVRKSLENNSESIKNEASNQASIYFFYF